MKKVTGILIVCSLFALPFADIIDFSGGTAHLSGGSEIITTDDECYYNVDYYIEDGFLIDFVNGDGIIGNYYQMYTGIGDNNAVIHAHPFYSIDIVFSKIDHSAFDLNYIDLTSNTMIGGGQSTGDERSYITANDGSSMLLPSSDWGNEVLFDGVTPSDGIARLSLPNQFNNITNFTISSENAYCFGMDNFYINEPPPTQSVPEPGLTILLIIGLVTICGTYCTRNNKIRIGSL